MHIRLCSNEMTATKLMVVIS